MTPRRGSLMGDTLLCCWGLLLYYVFAYARFVRDPAYGIAFLLLLALSLWGLGLIALSFIRAASQAPTGGDRRQSSDDQFTNFHEGHHDDHSDRDAE